MGPFEQLVEASLLAGPATRHILTGGQVAKLMRKHKVTIRDLSAKTGITLKRIREVLSTGLADANSARDWIQAITGVDPGASASMWPV